MDFFELSVLNVTGHRCGADALDDERALSGIIIVGIAAFDVIDEDSKVA